MAGDRDDTPVLRPRSAGSPLTYQPEEAAGEPVSQRAEDHKCHGAMSPEAFFAENIDPPMDA
jgi:hypothetical protein